MKVFIAEDSETVRKNLQAMLSGIYGVEIAGYAENEAGAISGVESLLPDVVILDLHLQSGSGLNVLERIKKKHAAFKVIVLSNFATEPYVNRCKELGADYFFDKTFQFMAVGTVVEQLASHQANHPAGI